MLCYIEFPINFFEKNKQPVNKLNMIFFKEIPQNAYLNECIGKF